MRAALYVALDSTFFFPLTFAAYPSNALVRHVLVIMIEAPRGLNSVDRKIVISVEKNSETRGSHRSLSRAINVNCAIFFSLHFTREFLSNKREENLTKGLRFLPLHIYFIPFAKLLSQLISRFIQLAILQTFFISSETFVDALLRFWFMNVHFLTSLMFSYIFIF